jgi:hypothetical protein
MLDCAAMLYLPISRSWIFSLAAQRVYFVSALLAFALMATLVGVRAAVAMAGARTLNPPAASIVRMLLYPEVLGAAVLWVAMWYFWFSFDGSHYLKKAAWFGVLLFVPIGTLSYYFVVYRRSIPKQIRNKF